MIRWYNRLAAWTYDLVGDTLMDLALPVWIEEAEADYDENFEAEVWAQAAREDRIAREAYEDGRADGYNEALGDYPDFNRVYWV